MLAVFCGVSAAACGSSDSGGGDPKDGGNGGTGGGHGGTGGTGSTGSDCTIAADCPGEDTFCQTRKCEAGLCGFNYQPNGTTATGYPDPGYCQQTQCDGAGNPMVLTDDTNLPPDNECAYGECNAGVSSYSFRPLGAKCQSANMCNETGECVDCLMASDCGTDTLCKTFNCANYECAVSNLPIGTGCGTGWCDDAGECVAPEPSIAAGGEHSCILNSLGVVMCWGKNSHGQLGDNSTSDRYYPMAVSGFYGSGFTAIATGGLHSCATTSMRAALCWGDNTYGQIGDNTTTDRHVPTLVSTLESGVTAISAGRYHTCAIGSTGQAFCWGYNASGQLGDNTTVNKYVPTPVMELDSNVAAIATGTSHTCAITGTGAVLCWGDNSYGQLGDDKAVNTLVPLPVSGLESSVVAISAGERHTCAITKTGEAVCWGGNSSGQLGDNTGFDKYVPTPVVGFTSAVASISCGGNHSCSLTSTGGALCWGWNGYGQLGDNTAGSNLSPGPVWSLESSVTVISAGQYHTCALLSTGGARCWGRNNSGQLGNSTTNNSYIPTQVTSFP